jgi:hypothetical protein
MIKPWQLKRGDRVRIRRGAQVHTMYPGKADYQLKRSQVIKVDHTIGDKVRWAGSAGYWNQTSIENIIERT